MFYLAYFGAICFIAVSANGGNPFGPIPKIRFLLSLIGMDGYLNTWFPTFYLVGEWFFGLIVILYLLFPLLRAGVRKQPALTAGAALALFFLALFLLPEELPFGPFRNVFLRIPEFLFGMIFAKIFSEKKMPAVMPAVAVVLLFASGVLRDVLPRPIVLLLTGMSVYSILYFIFSKFRYGKGSARIFKTAAVYTYPVYLLHHFVMFHWFLRFREKGLGIGGALVVTAAYIVILLLLSVALKKLTDAMTGKSILPDRSKKTLKKEVHRNE